MTNNCIHAVNGLCIDCSQYQKWIKELEAQVAGLVGALKSIGVFCTHFGKEDCNSNRCSACMQLDIIDNAISTLPSTFLEIQKAKDACVEAIKKSISMAQQRCDWSFGSWDSIYNVRGYCIAKPLEQALHTLQQAQNLAGQSKKEDV